MVLDRVLQVMTRGRPSKHTDNRYLLELALDDAGKVMTSELVALLDVSGQTVRNNMRQLEADGLVEVTELEGTHVYNLTEEGRQHISEILRGLVD